MTRSTVLASVVVVACASLLAGCGEKVQTAQQGERKQDVPAWKGANEAYAAPGFKSSDEAAWQRQINQRAQGQNEYVRIGAQKSGS